MSDTAAQTGWAEQIAAQASKQLGRKIDDMVPIDKGWLNAKWKMETQEGPLFVKLYHPDRYKLHLHADRLTAMEQTLRLQHGLQTAGVPCPAVYAGQVGYLHQLPSGLHYAVLDWSEGDNVPAGHFSEAQMHSLGAATGRMHAWLRQVPPLAKPAWQPDRAAYFTAWELNREKAKEANDTVVLGWQSKSQRVVESMDFGIFEGAVPGWLHWDLWVDNILVHGRDVSAIVDFDRMTMAYQDIDVARALLSGALRNGELDTAKVRSFMDGYREYNTVTDNMLLRAFSMLFLIESIWWQRTEIRKQSELRGLLTRFIEEMNWIGDNWDRLPEQLREL
ncbi:phosphotransferase enzyme family protein [Paenibacillus whitsoniae]|uniref:phosphotransferase enzyme family protein n=1 Tax=Paenibacillus whitsoniae TaxID=2496558 RepID=UPI0013E01D54|nr:phosphotransferase [Paenibacillus whitsoniae]